MEELKDYFGMDAHKEFKPYDKVLARGIFDNRWWPQTYCGCQTRNGELVHFIQGSDWAFKDGNVIPYEGNEHLTGKETE